MKVQAKVTNFEDVEIDEIAVTRAVLDEIYKKFIGGDHIRNDIIYKYSFTDCHNGDDHYEKDRPATNEELQLNKAIKLIQDKLRELQELK